MIRHQPFTLLLHIALAIILAGAFVTHFLGIQGTLVLYSEAEPTSRFVKESGPGKNTLPFAVSLKEVETIYYPGTTTPMDFRSVIMIDNHEISIAMNRVGEYDGWRFYQAAIGWETSTLSVSHDPWGTGITYAGYLLLGISMIGFFLQKNTKWRVLLRKYRKGAAVAMLLMIPFLSNASLPAMQRPLAANFGKTLVYWNGRICPMQTLARDVTFTLYGSDSYNGLTAEQVLSGWLFYYDEWQRDYLESHPQLKSVPPFPVSKKDRKLAGQLGIVEWLGTGEIFRIYPYLTADGYIEWLSLTGRRPSGISLEQWTFMQTTMQDIKRYLLEGKNIKANETLARLMEGQRQYAVGVMLPSERKIMAEIWYNSYIRPAMAGIPAIIIGLFTLIFPLRYRRLGPVSLVASVVLTLYVGLAMGLLWWISGHVPLSNGPETMMFMALASFAGACLCRDLTLRGALMTIGAMALFVTAMGGRTPQIGSMMPVLASPLLSIHVMVVMISYALFFLMAILSALALLSRSEERIRHYSVLNRIILTPAVFLLGAGIFIGAVWANQTWGRYWGWDPKETCALVMWLIYALPLHWGSRRLSFFRKPRVLHIYLLSAILTVLFTYFGANYLLSGLHSYA